MHGSEGSMHWVVESPASVCVLKYNSRGARPGMLRMRRCNPKPNLDCAYAGWKVGR